MSYIYKSDGTSFKTNQIIEHLDLCLGALCLSNERNIQEEKPKLKCPDQIPPKQCDSCAICDKFQCPISRPCPVCSEIKDQQKKVSSKISEPYIITKQMTVNNLLIILDEYLEKLERYNINAIKKYILYSDVQDIIKLLEGNKNLDTKYIYKEDLGTKLNEYADYDKVQQIKILLTNNNIINIPNITKVNSAFSIMVNFQPNVIEGFGDNYSVQGIYKTTKIIEGFISKFDIYGSFELYLIDMEIDNNQTYRYMMINLSDTQKLSLNNALLYNIPFEISINNNNIAPNTYDTADVLTFAKNFLHALFTKPDFENYIYYENETNKNNTDIIKNNIDIIQYKEQETNIFIDQTTYTKSESIEQFSSFIKTHTFGDVIGIEKVFKFNLNINDTDYPFFIYDLKLSDYKIYRFLRLYG